MCVGGCWSGVNLGEDPKSTVRTELSPALPAAPPQSLQQLIYLSSWKHGKVEVRSGLGKQPASTSSWSKA